MNKIYEFIGKRKSRELRDVDFHDFMELKERGLKKSEIAKELGVSEREVRKLIEDIETNR
ncbi:hypothetical protein [Caldisalinibacter kiritimatiensis]|uniref:Uncharacterized protein n=1 Tax=Caldisalinibacter kiritimatiensis TaxID=1304284 RepID=R1CED3_9FIRM|nr:hypothetical protein [Caldisalinibacter kiritimatiensis]EOD00655.1 hypothetical protein L21TH_1256 [Caldisalinibacter kiritimatiensis]